MHRTVRKRSNYSRILFTDLCVTFDFYYSPQFPYHSQLYVPCTMYLLFFPSRGSEYLLLACAAEAFLKWKGTNWCKCENVIGAVSATTLSHPPPYTSHVRLSRLLCDPQCFQDCYDRGNQDSLQEGVIEVRGRAAFLRAFDSMVSNPCSGSELTLIVSRTPLPLRGRKLRNVSKYVLFLSYLPRNSLIASDVGGSRRVFRPVRSGTAEGVRFLVQIQEGAHGGPFCVRELLYEFCEHVRRKGSRGCS